MLAVCVAGVAAATLGVGISPATATVDTVDTSAGTRPESLPRLRGTVGPGFDIWINKDSVPAGRYKLVVHDRGTIHNFHFFGPGVDHETSVPGTGRKVWRVTLVAGTYVGACVPHGSMATALEVT